MNSRADTIVNLLVSPKTEAMSIVEMPYAKRKSKKYKLRKNTLDIVAGLNSVRPTRLQSAVGDRRNNKGSTLPRPSRLREYHTGLDSYRD